MTRDHAHPTGSFPHASDLELIRFEVGPTGGEGHFDLTPELARHDGALYGGTGAAAAVMAMESATQRDALWVATQFVAQAHIGDRIDWAAHKLAQGGRIAQLQVVASVGNRMIFCALGATALPRPGGLNGQYDAMPGVTSPEDSPPFRHRHRGTDGDDLAFHRNIEFREAAWTTEKSRDVALWARLAPGGTDMTRARIAFVADMVPMAITRTAERVGGGFSLDNSLRFSSVPPTDWVLLRLRGEMASHGYGHGSLTAWSTDGTLVATGSQTASMAYMLQSDEESAVVR